MKLKVGDIITDNERDFEIIRIRQGTIFTGLQTTYHTDNGVLFENDLENFKLKT